MKIKRLKRLFATLTIGFLMTACATVNAPPERFTPITKTLSTIGQGTVAKNNQFSPSQAKLMAMRASKMDAYRNLAEQIYGIQVDGKTTVENMIVTNDHYRSFFEAYMRGAIITKISAISGDIYETAMEIDLTPRFYECLRGSGVINHQCVQ